MLILINAPPLKRFQLKNLFSFKIINELISYFAHTLILITPRPTLRFHPSKDLKNSILKNKYALRGPTIPLPYWVNKFFKVFWKLWSIFKNYFSIITASVRFQFASLADVSREIMIVGETHRKQREIGQSTPRRKCETCCYFRRNSDRIRKDRACLCGIANILLKYAIFVIFF